MELTMELIKMADDTRKEFAEVQNELGNLKELQRRARSQQKKDEYQVTIDATTVRAADLERALQDLPPAPMDPAFLMQEVTRGSHHLWDRANKVIAEFKKEIAADEDWRITHALEWNADDVTQAVEIKTVLKNSLLDPDAVGMAIATAPSMREGIQVIYTRWQEMVETLRHEIIDRELWKHNSSSEMSNAMNGWRASAWAHTLNRGNWYMPPQKFFAKDIEAVKVWEFLQAQPKTE